MAKDAADTAEDFFHARRMGNRLARRISTIRPGYSIHEVGTCRMGDNPKNQRAE